MKPSFSIGIEEEYQTIDPVTYDLRSHINAEIIAKGIRHPGFAFIEILSPCVTFRPEQRDWKTQVHAAAVDTTDDAARAARRIMTDDGFNTGVLYAGDRKAYAAPRNPAPRTVAALPRILRELKTRGYRIVHVVPATPDRPATPTVPPSSSSRCWAMAAAPEARRKTADANSAATMPHQPMIPTARSASLASVR